MADKKITQLTNITGANLVDADEFVVVDISADETKAITLGELKEAFDSGSGFVRITGDTMTGDLGFGDNDKAIFGAGSDLSIYHDGVHSRLKETGTGGFYFDVSNSLFIRRNDTSALMASFETGTAKLYYDNALKLATTSTGINVTGAVTADGLTVDGTDLAVSFNGSSKTFVYLTEGDTTDLNTKIYQSGGNFGIQTISDDLTTSKNRLKVDHATGDISFYEDTGTTPKFFWDASAESLELTSAIAGAGGWNEALTLQGSYPMIALNETGTSKHSRIGNNADGGFQFYVNGTSSNVGTNALNIDSSGRVGIGTSSPSGKLELQGGRTFLQSTSGDQYVLRLTNPANVSGVYLGNPSNNSFAVYTAAGTERMRIDSSGNVGIGTSSPDGILDIEGNFESNKALVLTNTQGTGKVSYLRSHGGNGETLALYHDGSRRQIWDSSGHIAFENGGSERMRLDASGNLLVGKTVTTYNTAGISLYAGGAGQFTASGNRAMYLNRLSTDGDILQFDKDGSTVGSIGTFNDYMTVGSGDTGLLMYNGGDVIRPHNMSSNTARDNAIDLGSTSDRFKDLYLSGTIEIENGTGNVGVGKQALNSNTASNNTAVGYQALYQNTTASSNTATGYQSMYYTNTGGANVAMGYLAGHNIRGGESNVALGYRALVTNQSGSNNTAVGRQALQAATSINNTALGYHAGYGITNGDQNVAVGYGSGPQSGTGSGALNVYIGSRAGAGTSTHSGNCIVGPQAGLLSTGSANTFIGSLVYGVTVGPGAAMTTGSKNTIIGGFSGNAGGLDIRTSNNRIVLSDGDGNIGLYIDNSQDAHFDGNVIAYSTTISDERLKTDIVKIESALDKVDQINGYTFTYTADGKKSAGVIAQEVEKVLPSAVNETAMPLKTGNDDLYKSVQYDQLIGLLVEAIKELKAEVAELKGQ